MGEKPVRPEVGGLVWGPPTATLRPKDMPYYALVRRMADLLPTEFAAYSNPIVKEQLHYLFGKKWLTMSPLQSDLDNAFFISLLLDRLRKNNIAVAIYSVPGLPYTVKLQIQENPEARYELRGNGENVIVALLRAIYYLKSRLE